jgi:hypothetical protein
MYRALRDGSLNRVVYDSCEPLVALSLAAALGRVPPTRRALTPGAMDRAVSALDAAFAVFAVGIMPTPELGAAGRAAVDAVQHRLAPWGTGGAYLTFSYRHKAGEALFGADTYRRLQQVKATYDPTALLRSNHPVTPV